MPWWKTRSGTPEAKVPPARTHQPALVCRLLLAAAHCDLPRNRTKLRELLESTNAVTELLMSNCGCENLCYQSFRVACGSTAVAIRTAIELRHERFETKFDNQRVYLRMLIEQSHSYDPQEERHRFDWVLRSNSHDLGLVVCEQAWFNIRGWRTPALNSVARKVMTSLRRRVRDEPLSRRLLVDGHTTRWNRTARWIYTYIGLHGQPRPAAEGVVGQVFIAKRELTDRHEIYVGELTHNGQLTQEQTGHFQYGQFRRVWMKAAVTWESNEGDIFDVIETEERVRGFSDATLARRFTRRS